MQQHRHTVSIEIKAANHSILSRVANDPTLKVMVFCSGEAHGRQDIAFPHQSEIKVNGGEIRANLRGLKGKPGSTRPADITSSLRLKLANYANTVDMTYALTSKAGGGSPQVSPFPVKAARYHTASAKLMLLFLHHNLAVVVLTCVIEVLLGCVRSANSACLRFGEET